MSVTIKDVAKKAGVSISTVSKCINGGNVLEPKKTEILNAIEELNYKVNPIARGMKTKKTRTIGVLIPNLSDYYGVSILTSVSQFMYEKNYSTIVCDYHFYDDGTNNAKEKIDFLLDYQVDGIIMQPIGVKSSDFTRIRKEKVPLVFVDIEDQENYCDSVVIDNESITYEVIKHLVDNGHRNIALITGGSGIVTTDDRVAGYIRALQEGGMPFRPEYVFKESITEESGYAGMKSFMSLPTPPTAVFAAGHDLMSGSLLYVADNNISIPDDISFVGFENLEIARIYNPKLTIGIQPMEKIARVASDMLLDRMTGTYLGVARKRKVDTMIEYGSSVKIIN